MTHHTRRTIVLVVALAALLALTGFAFYNAQSVKAISVTYDQNSGSANDVTTKTIKAKSQETIQTMLKDNGYTIDKDIYAYSVNLHKKVGEVSAVTITKKAKGTVTIGDKKIGFSSADKTVGKMLKNIDVNIDKDDIVTPSTNSILTTKIKNVNVVKVTKTKVRSENILPYTTQIVASDTVNAGQSQVLSEGVVGKQSVTTEATYYNGKLIGQKEVAKEVVKAPTVSKIAVNKIDYENAKKAEAKANAEKTTDTNKTIKTSKTPDTLKNKDASKPASTTDTNTKTTQTKDTQADKTGNSQTTSADTAKTNNAEKTVTTTKTETVTEVIPFKTIRIDTINLEKGQEQVTQTGVNGSQAVTYTVTYQNGKEVSRVPIKTTIITNPKIQLVSVGTKEVNTQGTATNTKQVNTAQTNASQTKQNASSTQNQTSTVRQDTSTNTAAKANQKAATSSATQSNPTTQKVSNTQTSASKSAQNANKLTVQKTAAVKTKTVTAKKTYQLSTYASSVKNATTGHKTESVSASNLDFICAVVAAEDDTSYKGALAVITCVMNRVDSPAWHGNTAVAVLKAKGQFAAYFNGSYKKYLNGKYPKFVKAAVTDCMTGGLRNHNYKGFRSYKWKTMPSYKIGGNYYADV